MDRGYECLLLLSVVMLLVVRQLFPQPIHCDVNREYLSSLVVGWFVLQLRLVVCLPFPQPISFGTAREYSSVVVLVTLDIVVVE